MAPEASYDLIILGCGPVGGVAANLAGAAGLSALVIDRAETVFDLPRAIHFDAHVMRILQQAGVSDAVLPHTRVWKQSVFYGADGDRIRVQDWPSTNYMGWDAHYLFYQPELERLLREGIERQPLVELALGREATEIDQADDHVTVRLRDVRIALESSVQARFLIAADGASSFTRLSLDIPLIDGRFDEPWMVIDLICEQAIGEEGQSEMFCDPRRPATRVPGPGNHHRFEFMLLPGETPQQIQQPKMIAELLRPWVAVEHARILRASVYRFHALVADRWRSERVFLAGDAAHQTPVFLGQGFCHGARDVHNLVWKLRSALRNGPQQELLDSYESERRQHVETIISMAVSAGREICLLDPVAAAERDARIRHEAATGSSPRTTFQGTPDLRGGLFKRNGGGELAPQPLVVSRAEKSPQRMDDVIGPGAGVIATVLGAEELFALRPDLGVPVITVDGGSGRSFTSLSDHPQQWLAERGGRLAVLRPDCYVDTITDDPAGALAALDALTRLGVGD